MKLSQKQIDFMQVFAKSCRRSILKMVSGAQSGHPGGSLSSLDYLVTLYLGRLCETNEPVIVSHGHISPAVYSVLGELGVFDKERAIEHFRKPDDIFEGHINRKVPGIFYGTGPLGTGGSVGCGYAIAEKLSGGADRRVFVLMGDGEQQEGQVYEMMNFAVGHHLENLTLFIDYNQVQLSDALSEIMPTNIEGHYKAAGWNTILCDGHDFADMWNAIEAASLIKDRPTVIIGNTVMGKGVDFMEIAGKNLKSDWHGKPPKKEDAEKSLEASTLSEEEEKVLAEGLKSLKINIDASFDPESVKVNVGSPRTYEANVMTDCRSAYGAALTDLAGLNQNILALTADLADSVKTDGVKKNFPERHIECGIAEQHMISTAGGLSLNGFVPFASTFGAFMTSRAKDQARVNDINETNVKMVATHCGLSVGEDGPTHQAIDDISSFEGFMHTQILEPADPNQCDRMIRYVASHYGNFYVRMGRSKTPVILNGTADLSKMGEPFFAGDYEFKPGKADIVRVGTRATLVASGAMLPYALKAAEEIASDGKGDIEVICVSSFVPFDSETITASARKTGRVVTVHDHNVRTGLGKYVIGALFEAGVQVPLKQLGVYEYQLSGTADALYEKAGMSTKHIVTALKELIG
jgi:transketolase